MNSTDLLKSTHFCILPFVHACVWTDGRVIPCCINQHYELGNTKSQSLTTIFSNSNTNLKSLRKEMINGPTLPKSCIRCSKPEETYGATSYRQNSNASYGHLLDKIIFDTEGNVEEEKLSLWDVRFSNLCNLKCRTCDSINSSKIAEEEYSRMGKNIPILQAAFDDHTAFFEFFIKHLDNIEEIYFCGGEPLLLDEHYKILDLLIAKNKFDTVLRYNTNGTKLTFKSKNVVTDYWPKFKNVRLGISLDAGWEQLEYIRYGTKWQGVLDNLVTIKKHCPNILLQIGPTVSILNAFHIMRLHEFLVDNAIVGVNNFYYNILTDPCHYSLTSLPSNLKQLVEEHWNLYANTLSSKGANAKSIENLLKVIKYMNSEDTLCTLAQLKVETTLKDSFRNESFVDVYPEYKVLYDGL